MMNSDKKRLIIYIALSFGLTFFWYVITIPKGKNWEEMSYEMQSFVALGMLFPMIAHVLTRFITKEGFSMTGDGSMMLGISFKSRNWVYFVIAMFLPWVYMEFGNIISLLICPDLYDPEYYKTLEIDKNMLYILPINAIVSGTIISIAAFGEEGGWRGYMMPKLMKLTSRHKALLIGGILWGLWHAPLTCIGHNFGTDYIGFPYLGILKMCLFCIMIGVVFTYITEKSGSVWTAAIMHAVNNAQPSILNGYINPDKADGILAISPGWAGLLISITVVAVVVLVVWWRGEKEIL